MTPRPSAISGSVPGSGVGIGGIRVEPARRQRCTLDLEAMGINVHGPQIELDNGEAAERARGVWELIGVERRREKIAKLHLHESEEGKRI